MFQLEIVIMDAYFRPEFNFLNLSLFLVFLGFMLFFVEFIKKLAIIHDPAHRGSGLRGDFNQIKPFLPGDSQGLRDRHYTQLILIFINYSNFWRPDHFIYPVGMLLSFWGTIRFSLENR